MTEEGAVRITQREIYDKVNAVDDAVSKMSTLLETHIELTKQNQASLESRLGGVDTRLEAHGTRLSSHDAEILTQNGRINNVETRLDEQRARKAPWWAIIAAVVGIITGIGALGGIFVGLSHLANTISAVN